MASVWISDRHHQAAFTTVCLRFVLVLDCYGSLSHILYLTVTFYILIYTILYTNILFYICFRKMLTDASQQETVASVDTVESVDTGDQPLPSSTSDAGTQCYLKPPDGLTVNLWYFKGKILCLKHCK